MYTMMQACKETNMSYQALKYYCNEGLVPNVKRDSNNRRVFDEHDVKWIKDLVCLKRCGMSILEMKEYLELCLWAPPPSRSANRCLPKSSRRCAIPSRSCRKASPTSTGNRTFMTRCSPASAPMSAT